MVGHDVAHSRQRHDIAIYHTPELALQYGRQVCKVDTFGIQTSHTRYCSMMATLGTIAERSVAPSTRGRFECMLQSHAAAGPKRRDYGKL